MNTDHEFRRVRIYTYAWIFAGILAGLYSESVAVYLMRSMAGF